MPKRGPEQEPEKPRKLRQDTPTRPMRAIGERTGSSAGESPEKRADSACDEDSPTVAELPAGDAPAPPPGFAAEIRDDLVTDAAEALRLIRDPEPEPSASDDLGISLEDLGIPPPSPSSPPSRARALTPARGPAPGEPTLDDEDTVSDQPSIPAAADAPPNPRVETDDIG